MRESPTGRAGRVQVIAGPMFAGKSEELMRRVRRARLAGRDVEVIGHGADDRHGSGAVASHIGTSIPARTADDLEALRGIVSEHTRDLVAIDEAQFFGEGLPQLVDDLALRGSDVVIAGLCVTYDGGPFAPLPSLMAAADEVMKLTAVCTVCGADAAFHVRLARDAGGAAAPHDGDGAGPPLRVPAPLEPTAEAIGGAESYQARCRLHRAPAEAMEDHSSSARQGGPKSG